MWPLKIYAPIRISFPSVVLSLQPRPERWWDGKRKLSRVIIEFRVIVTRVSFVSSLVPAQERMIL